MFSSLFAAQGTVLLLFISAAWGYIPATPVNATAGGSTLDNNSTLSMSWKPNAAYSATISYQLVGDASVGVSKGALLLVEERNIVGRESTPTPWIAFINCDVNTTDVSMEVDIFTIAQKTGAVAALLYSNTSSGCLLNEAYLRTGLDANFDIFTTKSASSTRIVLSQFQNVEQSHTVFNSALLNSSSTSVTEALAQGSTNNSPYIVAALKSGNATRGSQDGSTPVPTTPASGNAQVAISHSWAIAISHITISAVFMFAYI